MAADSGALTLWPLLCLVMTKCILFVSLIQHVSCCLVSHCTRTACVYRIVNSDITCRHV